MSDPSTPRDHRALAYAVAGVGLIAAFVALAEFIYLSASPVLSGVLGYGLLGTSLVCHVVAVRKGLDAWQRDLRVPSVAFFYAAVVVAVLALWGYGLYSVSRI